MANGANILLQARPLDVGRLTSSILGNIQGLQSVQDRARQAEFQQSPEFQRMQQAQLAAQTQQATSETNRLRMQDLAGLSFQIKPLLESGNVQQAASVIQGSGINEEDKLDALQLLQQDPQQLLMRANQAIDFGSRLQGVRAQPTASERDFDKFQELQAKAKETGLESDKVAAKQFGRQAGFVSKEGQELSSFLQKELKDSSELSVEANRNVSDFNSLASELDQAAQSGGIVTTASEFIKQLTGNRDKISQLRTRFNKIKGSQVVKNLPPGAASDTDIALALKGFPPENAETGELASFLRGMAKIESEVERFNSFKNDYISETGSLRGFLKSWRNEEAGKIGFEPATQEQQAQKRLRFDAQGNIIQ